MKNFSFARLVRAFFIFEHFPSRPFDGVKSVVLHLYGWQERTWQILKSSYLRSADSNLISGYLEHIL